MTIKKIEVEDGKPKCHFCGVKLADSGGCTHVVYTHTTTDGFLFTSPDADDIIETYKKNLCARLFEEQKKLDPDLTIDDIEVSEYIEPDDLKDFLDGQIDQRYLEAILLETYAVWGSTASYLVVDSKNR